MKKEMIPCQMPEQHTNHFHFAPDRQPFQHFLTQLLLPRCPFHMINQQCQSTSGKQHENNICIWNKNYFMLHHSNCSTFTPHHCKLPHRSENL